jgi:hypothetical protein
VDVVEKVVLQRDMEMVERVWVWVGRVEMAEMVERDQRLRRVECC